MYINVPLYNIMHHRYMDKFNLFELKSTKPNFFASNRTTASRILEISRIRVSLTGDGIKIKKSPRLRTTLPNTGELSMNEELSASSDNPHPSNHPRNRISLRNLAGIALKLHWYIRGQCKLPDQRYSSGRINAKRFPVEAVEGQISSEK